VNAGRLRAASFAAQRPPHAKLLVVSSDGRITHTERARLSQVLRAHDLVVANDAATLPASLSGTHGPSGAPIEVRLAGRRTLRADDVRAFSAIVFGAGDHRTRTEDRAAPPPLHAGDALQLGPLRATVQRTLGHPRLIELRLEGAVDAVWAGIARHGKPIQYAHVQEPLALWDVWSAIAGLPAAFEPPSAGFVLDWALLDALHERGIGFATLTHAAGISSTGDAALDARLPLDEPYHVPPTTVAAIERAQREGGRVVAVGTTVTRALEHAARHGRLRAGDGVADQRIGAATQLRVVDAIVSGAHEPDSSHHELLSAFVAPQVLQRVDRALLDRGYLTHEFGDSVLIERREPRPVTTVTSARWASVALQHPPRTRGPGTTPHS
jgi:S-adenosylmethionine:tRNA ribosyltransferase-isomerase